MPVPSDARERSALAEPDRGPLAPAHPRATGTPLPQRPVASPPAVAAAHDGPGGQTPEGAPDTPRVPSITARPVPPPPLRPAVLNPPARVAAAPAPGGPAVPGREQPSPSPPLAGLPPSSAGRPVSEAPGDREQQPISGTRSASLPTGIPPVPGSPGGPGSGGVPPSPVRDLAVPPVASQAPPSPVQPERQPPRAAATSSPPLVTTPDASVPSSADSQASAPSRVGVPFARGAPLGGAAGGRMPLDARWTVEALARNVPDPTSLPASTERWEAQTLDLARRGVVRVAASHELSGGRAMIERRADAVTASS